MRGKKSSDETEGVGIARAARCPSGPSAQELDCMHTGEPLVRHGPSPGETEVAALAPETYLRFVHYADRCLGELISRHDCNPEALVLRVLERACDTFDPRQGDFRQFVYSALKDEIKRIKARYAQEKLTYGDLVRSAERQLGGLARRPGCDPHDLVQRVLERAGRTFDPTKGSLKQFVYGTLKYEVLDARCRYAEDASTHIPLDGLDEPIEDSAEQLPVSKETRDDWAKRTSQPGPEDQAMADDACFDPSDTFDECIRALSAHVAGYRAYLAEHDPFLAEVYRGLLDDVRRQHIAARLNVDASAITNAFKRIERGQIAHILAGELAAGGAFVRGLWRAIGADPDDLPVPGGWRALARIWVGLCQRRTLDALAAELSLTPAAVRRARDALQLACKSLPHYVRERRL
jgi:hypothetical protein